MRGTVVGLLADGRLVAVAGFGAARFVARYRALLLDGADGAAALELAARSRPLRPGRPRPRPRPRRQRKSLRNTASTTITPSGHEAVLDLRVGEPLLQARPSLVDEPLRAGALAEHVEALGERVPRFLDLSLDGVRVARHDAS